MKIKSLFFLICFLICFCRAVLGNELAITEIIPPRAFPGDRVLVKGVDLASSVVFFGDIKVKPITIGEGGIEVVVPDGIKVCDVYVEYNGVKSNEIKFYVMPYVELKLESSKIEIDKKISGIIRVYGSKKPWTVQVINKYYEIIELDGGRDITVTTSGGEENTATIGITARKKGNFNINFKVLSGDPDALKEHQEELKAKRLEEDQSIKKAETKPSQNINSKPEKKLESKAEVKTMPKVAPKTEPKAEVKTVPKVEPKTEPKAEVKTMPKAEPKTEPKAEVKTMPKVELKSKIEEKTDEPKTDKILVKELPKVNSAEPVNPAEVKKSNSIPREFFHKSNNDF